MSEMKSQRVHDGFVKGDVLDTAFGKREVVRVTDSVRILIHDITNKGVILVRQVRESQICKDNPEGKITELVAGRFDEQIGVQELMAKEASEEAGVTVAPEAVELLNGCAQVTLSAGVLTERTFLGYVEVRCAQIEEEDREFGVDPGEHIERICMPIYKFLVMQCEDIGVFALREWFKARLMQHKIQKLKDSWPQSGDSAWTHVYALLDQPIFHK